MATSRAALRARYRERSFGAGEPADPVATPRRKAVPRPVDDPSATVSRPPVADPSSVDDVEDAILFHARNGSLTPAVLDELNRRLPFSVRPDAEDLPAGSSLPAIAKGTRVGFYPRNLQLAGSEAYVAEVRRSLGSLAALRSFMEFRLDIVLARYGVDSPEAERTAMALTHVTMHHAGSYARLARAGVLGETGQGEFSMNIQPADPDAKAARVAAIREALDLDDATDSDS